ncbi:MAG: glycosyltransferase [Gammaproteobacteria bacterium]
MRVLYLTSLFPCWSETFIVREILALQAMGVDIRIVSLKPPTERMVQSDAAKLLDRVIYPPAGARGALAALFAGLRHPIETARMVFSILRGLRTTPTSLAKSLVVVLRTLAMLEEMRRFAPDHLHAHWATYPSTAALFASRMLGVPFSFTSHAHDIFLEDHLLALKLAEAKFGVTISEFNRRFIAERIGSEFADKLRIVHCGISPQAFPFEVAQASSGRIVAVGRLDEIKGFEHLVRACALLRDEGVPFSCRIIGDGPLRTSLQQQIDAASLAGHVVLAGAMPQEAVRSELRAAAMFVLPSVVTRTGDRDGIPVALMEAMALGIPVVSTHVSGIPELIQDGVSGHLAQPASATELADCMRRSLALTAPQRQRQCEAARRTVEEGFDISKEAARLLGAVTARAA